MGAATGAAGSATSSANGVTGAASGAQGAATGAAGVVKTGQGQLDSAKGALGGGAAAPAGAGDAGNADDTRLNAVQSSINAPLDDKCDYKTDKVDWRKFTLAAKPGPAVFELHWDDENSDLSVDVFNSFGDNIGHSPRRLEGTQAKRVVIAVDPKLDKSGKGVYYARVQCANKKDNSIYTLQVKYDEGKKPEGDAAGGGDNGSGGGNKSGGAAGGAAAAGTAPAGGAAGGAAAGATTPVGGQPPAPSAPPAPVPFAQDPTKVLGKIVGAYKDGGGWVFQIDRGSGNGVQPNMTGALLDGDDGDKLVEGGSFSVTQVVSDSKSIARASGLTKPLGRNKRVVINLK